jgi:two-component system phosphate regulon sensor histidine kinase PhoR
VIDLPPSAETFVTRAVQRLYSRRWLVAVSASVVLLFVLAYGLPPLPALLGFIAIAGGAALLPREDTMRPLRLNRATPPREASNEAMAGLLEGLPAPAILLSAQGRISRFNSLARDFLPALRSGAPISAFIRDPGVLAAVAGAAARRRQVVAYEQRVPVEHHIEVTVSWIGPESGNPPDNAPAILLHLRDLTEQERLERLREDFVANASHELRTPLASLLGFIETLQGAARNDAAAREQFLAIMARQAQRMARLLDNLLSLSRVEMREHLRPQARVDLGEVAEQVMAALAPMAEKTQIAMHLERAGGDAIVLGDRDELVQIVANLVENAIKYGRSGGNVWVGIAPDEEAGASRFRLTVRDDGIGIDAKHLPRLTERFYRAHDEGGEKSGTGLGLAIVKHVVTRHRGELQIASKPGKGSTFDIILNEAPRA